ncbi:MAG: transcriptional regulator, TetR family [Caulobacter sp.]|nr:transcriptional regulator, TetR family [Caulobacter sp.]
MNHVPMRILAASAAPVRTTRRALAKQKTREKVLAAARQLFVEHGYEAATIRDIAKAAGMSTGAVFASFSDKAELFDEILIEDFNAVYEPMTQAVAVAANVDDAIRGIFTVAYDYCTAQLPLLRAGIAVSWTRGDVAEHRNRSALKPIFNRLNIALKEGVERGELLADSDTLLISNILWDVYLAGYRGALYDGLSSGDLIARMVEKTNVILAGFRQRP